MSIIRFLNGYTVCNDYPFSKYTRTLVTPWCAGRLCSNCFHAHNDYEIDNQGIVLRFMRIDL